MWTALPWDPSGRNFTATFSLAIARVKPGVTPDTATRELVELTPARRKDLGKAGEWGQTIRVQLLRDAITGGAFRPTDGVTLNGAVGYGLSQGSVGGRAGVNLSW